MIKRKIYLDKIEPFIDKPLIKVLTGIRRSGKSALLMMLREELLLNGIQPDNIIYINFESMEYWDIKDAMSLYKYIIGKVVNKDRYYILLDEIQDVESWERAVNSFLVDFDSDVYITGSNSKLLSSELSTYIAGRYIEININTLSFEETLYFKKEYQNLEILDTKKEFLEFLRMGGFPVVHTSKYNYEETYKIVFDIYSSAVLRDIVQRNNIRNIELLERVIKFVFDNIGNIFSAKKVADYFKSQQRTIDINTIHNYLEALSSAFILHKVQRYDVKGKGILQTNEKYFLGDHSLKYAVMGYKDKDIAGILENIVFLELKRRGYSVYIGKFDEKEIDFVAEKRGEKVYVQVAFKLSSTETIEREFSPLIAVRDHFPKYVVTMEEFWQDNIDGVKHIHIADFLLMKNF